VTNRERVLVRHPEAFMSDSGRIWKSPAEYMLALAVKGKHPTETEWFLGNGWVNAAARLESK